MLASKHVGWLLSGSMVLGLMSAGFIGETDQAWDAPPTASSSTVEALVTETTESRPLPIIDAPRLKQELEDQVETWLQAETVWR